METLNGKKITAFGLWYRPLLLNNDKKIKASYWMLCMWTSYLITKIQFLNIYIWVWKYVGSYLDRVDICIPPSFYNESTNLKQLLEKYSNALCESRVPIYMLFDFLNHHTQESKKLYRDLTLKHLLKSCVNAYCLQFTMYLQFCYNVIHL